MASVVKKLKDRNLHNPPQWLPDNIVYEAQMGSVAYGVSSDDSDIDVYGFCVPKKEDVFPHLKGEIPGFGRQHQRFEQYQQHHIFDPSNQKSYDITIFSIVKYFNLLMENNPNIVDSVFVPQRCVLSISKIGQMVRDNRSLFLHKGSWHKFKGYAYSQIHKCEGKNPEPGSKRALLRDLYGMDVKFAYHVVRLIGEAEQILTLGDIDLERDKEMLKAIRRGEWTLDQLKEFFTRREKELDTVYAESKLQHYPDEDKIKTLLLNCLEEHYGNLSNAIIQESKYVQTLRDIKNLLEGVNL